MCSNRSSYSTFLFYLLKAFSLFSQVTDWGLCLIIMIRWYYPVPFFRYCTIVNNWSLQWAQASRTSSACSTWQENSFPSLRWRFLNWSSMPIRIVLNATYIINRSKHLYKGKSSIVLTLIICRPFRLEYHQIWSICTHQLYAPYMNISTPSAPILPCNVLNNITPTKSIPYEQ